MSRPPAPALGFYSDSITWTSNVPFLISGSISGNVYADFAPNAYFQTNGDSVLVVNGGTYTGQLHGSYGWTGIWCIGQSQCVNEEVGYSLTLPPPTVPVPAAAWLFGSGLLCLGSVGRKCKAV